MEWFIHAVIGCFFLTGTQSYRATLKISSIGGKNNIRIGFISRTGQGSERFSAFQWIEEHWPGSAQVVKKKLSSSNL